MRLAGWMWAIMFRPPSARSVATANRTSGASPLVRNSGRTANRSPRHPASGAAESSGNSRTEPAGVPSTRPSTCTVAGSRSWGVAVARMIRCRIGHGMAAWTGAKSVSQKNLRIGLPSMCGR